MTSTLRDVADLFDILPDAVIVVDGSGRIALANTAVLRLLGYAAGELVGSHLDGSFRSAIARRMSIIWRSSASGVNPERWARGPCSRH